MQLAEEEKQQPALGFRRMYAHADYSGPHEYGMWSFGGVPSEKILAYYKVHATQAALVVGIPRNAEPLDYWMHRLFAYLKSAGSSHLNIYDAHGGGVIERVIEASVLYCVELHREALERPDDKSRAEMTTPRKRGRPPIADELKIKALEAKANGGSNRDAAKELYSTRYPTPQQVKNVPTILRHFADRMKKSNGARRKRPKIQ